MEDLSESVTRCDLRFLDNWGNNKTDESVACKTEGRKTSGEKKITIVQKSWDKDLNQDINNN